MSGYKTVIISYLAFYVSLLIKLSWSDLINAHVYWFAASFKRSDEECKNIVKKSLEIATMGKSVWKMIRPCNCTTIQNVLK